MNIDDLGVGRHHIQLRVRERPAGSLSLPLFVIRGRSPGPTLLVTAGVHPTEYAGIEAALRVGREVRPSELRGRIVVAPFVNVLGFNSRIPGGCPEDSVDLFGAFPGYPGGSVSHAIAHSLFQEVAKKADYVIDLHGGELNESESVSLAWFCKTGHLKVDRESRKIAAAFGPDYILDTSQIWTDSRRSQLPSGLLTFEAAKMGIPAIIGEGGGSGRAGMQETKRLYDGVLRVCRATGMLPGAVVPAKPRDVHDLTVLTTSHDGLLTTRTKAGRRVAKGDVLAEIRSWDGPVLQRVVAPYDGVVTITVNWLPVRAGEHVLAMVRA